MKRSFDSSARLVPYVLLAALASWLGTPATPARAGDDQGVVRLAPGRVMYSLTAAGRWTFFGVRGERALVNKGGVIVFATREGGDLDERASAARGGMRALLAADAIAPLSEGARGGARSPSIQPDDDGDGRVDEDAVDRIDNDGDGEVDEDFAAIGDEMVVAMYGTRGDGAVVIRQECYGWSLPHIDGMIASTLTVRNAGTRLLAGARVGVELEAASDLEVEATPAIEGSHRRSKELDAAFVEHPLVLRGRDRGLAVLLLAPRAGLAAGGRTSPPRATAWEIHADRSRVLAVSPDLGDLAPGASTVMYVALVALPSDDLKAARAIRNAHRTIVGDGTSRFIPPPVPLTAGSEESASRLGAGMPAGPSVAAEGAADPFWSQAGKLEEKLLIGAPNPFRDVVAIDYEVPSRVVDADGVEHTIGGAAMPTSVKVYNVAGRLVATLVDTEHAPGRYRTDWSAHGEDGNAVASGVYYVKLQIGKRSVTMRMVQLK